jgi:hypothetical protein
MSKIIIIRNTQDVHNHLGEISENIKTVFNKTEINENETINNINKFLHEYTQFAFLLEEGTIIAAIKNDDVITNGDEDIKAEIDNNGDLQIQRV